MTIEAHIQELATKYYEAYMMVTVFWQCPILSEQKSLYDGYCILAMSNIIGAKYAKLAY